MSAFPAVSVLSPISAELPEVAQHFGDRPSDAPVGLELVRVQNLGRTRDHLRRATVAAQRSRLSLAPP